MISLLTTPEIVDRVIVVITVTLFGGVLGILTGVLFKEARAAYLRRRNRRRIEKARDWVSRYDYVYNRIYWANATRPSLVRAETIPASLYGLTLNVHVDARGRVFGGHDIDYMPSHLMRYLLIRVQQWIDAGRPIGGP